MTFFIGFIIISQLDHFGFAPIASPQTAGDSFSVTAYAYDSNNNIYPYNGPARIFTSLGIQYGSRDVYFNSGVWQGYFRATLADTYSIRCQDYSSPPHTGQSNPIIFNPNLPFRLLTILPGQTHYPGVDTGKTGSVTPQQAGNYFNVSVYLTDRWCNRIYSANDSIRCNSSDQFKLPHIFTLNSGGVTFSYAFRTAGTRRLYLNDLSNTSIKPDTSSLVSIYAASYSRLLVLLPGETHLPGDTTSVTSNTPGKSGTPTTQYVLEDFTVKVYATDSMWNKTTVSGYPIQLISTSDFSNPPPQNLNNGETQFTVNFGIIGTKFIKAKDLVNNFESYLDNYINIIARATNINVVVDPDTITAGETAQITATVYDRSGTPIGGKLVTFSVIGGHGQIPASYVSVWTDTVGVCHSQFTCFSGYFNELDTIAAKADDSSGIATCYVMIPDSTVMEGNIVAFPNPFGIRRNKTTLMYYLAQDCNVIFAIYDPFGNLVHRRDISPGEEGARHGINRLEWNGRNDKGRKVASGIYYVVVKGFYHTNVFLEKRIKVGVIW